MIAVAFASRENGGHCIVVGIATWFIFIKKYYLFQFYFKILQY
jgi:hypothetical protein